MSDTVIVLWAGLVFALILNGCAAGVVAMLHAWRSSMGRGGKAVAAGFATGVGTGAMFMTFAIDDLTTSDTEGPLVVGLALAVFVAIATVVSLPGALIVARKLDRPGEDFRAFE